MSKTIAVPMSLVKIARGLESINKEVPAHEVDILFAIHGNDQMQVIDEDVGELDMDIDPDAEFARLQRKYDRKNAKYVEGVYRNAGEIARRLNVSMGPRGRNTDPVMSEVKLGHKAAKKPSKGKKAE